ncbi:MAG: sodium-independent anion transporter, partial [Deltaproteobacteria bacterium]|nr:sodium-independent anion transporter [Deltaproteobacteria bacterium]
MLPRIFPFLAWFKGYNQSKLRADAIAGVSVALVLVPQSMAYAQLAGLPVYYGLYASFLPPMLAALFGSSRQLATGPVAVVSLMTAASLEPLATAGGEAFIAYALLLALAGGFFQFMLGILRLGLAVNLLSHPVVNGFTNGAALIIATSQLSKLFGVFVDNSEHHYVTVINTFKAALAYTHWPTLSIGLLAFVVMYGLKYFNPRLPFVLVAVIITTVLSWAIGFEKNQTVPLSVIEVPRAKEMVGTFNKKYTQIEELSAKRTELTPKIAEKQKKLGPRHLESIELEHQNRM